LELVIGRNTVRRHRDLPGRPAPACRGCQPPPGPACSRGGSWGSGREGSEPRMSGRRRGGAGRGNGPLRNSLHLCHRPIRRDARALVTVPLGQIPAAMGILRRRSGRTARTTRGGTARRDQRDRPCAPRRPESKPCRHSLAYM
jgi:hypothetical protein